MRRLLCVVAVSCLPAAASELAFAQAALPEDRGPHGVNDFDAGRLPLAGAMIPVHVYTPAMKHTPSPLVAVVHGFTRDGSKMAEMARTFASWGHIALVPDMPCGLAGCNHAENAAQIHALLDWGEAESARNGSMLFGLVDPAHRSVVGHSWGALATFLASTRAAPRLDGIVLLDPNDDRNAGRDLAGSANVPSLLIAAEVLGSCNATRWSENVYPITPAPRFRVRIAGSGHCDAEEPGDRFCPIGCGRGDPAKSSLFRRYALAFVRCVVDADRGVAEWIGGASLQGDVTQGRVDQVDTTGLEALPCRAGASFDAGPGADTGRPLPIDAGVPFPDAADTEDSGTTDPDAAGNDDAGIVVEVDAAGQPGRDASQLADGAPGPAADGSNAPPRMVTPAPSRGCGCHNYEGPRGDRGELLAAALASIACLVAVRRRRAASSR